MCQCLCSWDLTNISARDTAIDNNCVGWMWWEEWDIQMEWEAPKV